MNMWYVFQHVFPLKKKKNRILKDLLFHFRQNYFVIGVDAYTLDYSRFDDISANITAIRMFDPWSNEIVNMIYENRRRFNGPLKENQLTVSQFGFYQFWR